MSYQNSSVYYLWMYIYVYKDNAQAQVTLILLWIRSKKKETANLRYFFLLFFVSWVAFDEHKTTSSVHISNFLLKLSSSSSGCSNESCVTIVQFIRLPCISSIPYSSLFLDFIDRSARKARLSLALKPLTVFVCTS